MKKLVEEWKNYMGHLVNLKEDIIKSQKEVLLEKFREVIDEVFEDLEFNVKEAILKSKKNYKKS